VYKKGWSCGNSFPPLALANPEAGTAVFLHESQRIVQRRSIRATGHDPTPAFLLDQTGSNQASQMERECRGRYSEMALDFADAKPFMAGPHKQPEDL
jgi:hypothetical protein